MRLAWFGPLPPVRSGIAHYATLLIPQLSEGHDVRLFSDQSEREPGGFAFEPSIRLDESEFDAVFVQIGNNPFHESQYRWALEHPAVVVIHDLVLHHLLVECTLARGDAQEYTEALGTDHGQEGRAWSAARAAGVHGEIGNFLFPAFSSIARGARHVIVHNGWAAERIRMAGIDVPVTVAPHPWIPSEPPEEAQLVGMRRRFEIPENARVISILGFVTAAKRVEETMRAFATLADTDPDAHLLIAGAPAPNIDLAAMAEEAGIVRNRWTATGYLSDEDFETAVALSDRVVNLRYPTAGETSGPLIRVIGAGRHVAVSDYAQFREIPAEAAVRIPLADGEHAALVDFMSGRSNCRPSLQRSWAAERLSPELAAEAYLRAARGEGDRPTYGRESTPAIPLFVDWRWSAVRADGGVEIDLQLMSDSPVRSATWGDPGYRVIVDVMQGNDPIRSEWISLRRDVHRGESVRLAIDVPEEWTHIRLRHGLSGIPAVDSSPWGVVENDAIR